MLNAEFHWLVPADHPAFAGHFPGRPIVPGVVLLDQAILCAEKMLGQKHENWQIGNAKFFIPVAPMQALTFTLNLKANASVGFTILHGNQDVASGSLMPRQP